MDDAILLGAELDLAHCSSRQCTDYVLCDSAKLGIRHEPPRTEDLSNIDNNWYAFQ